MRPEKEEKFIVINTKHLNELARASAEGNESVIAFVEALDKLRASMLLATGEDLEQKRYYACNQDEPYAEEVLETILNGELQKGLG